MQARHFDGRPGGRWVGRNGVSVVGKVRWREVACGIAMNSPGWIGLWRAVVVAVAVMAVYWWWWW